MEGRRADQLALEVEPGFALWIVERRGGSERTLRVGPLPEREARALAAMLLNRDRRAAGRRAVAQRGRRRRPDRHAAARLKGPRPPTGPAGAELQRAPSAAVRPRRGARAGEQARRDAVLLGSEAAAGSPTPPIARQVARSELVLAAVGAVGGHRGRVAARLALGDALERRATAPRPGRGRRRADRPSAARVSGPAMPSTAGRGARWKRRTRRRVIGRRCRRRARRARAAWRPPRTCCRGARGRGRAARRPARRRAGRGADRPTAGDRPARPRTASRRRRRAARRRSREARSDRRQGSGELRSRSGCRRARRPSGRLVAYGVSCRARAATCATPGPCRRFAPGAAVGLGPRSPPRAGGDSAWGVRARHPAVRAGRRGRRRRRSPSDGAAGYAVLAGLAAEVDDVDWPCGRSLRDRGRGRRRLAVGRRSRRPERGRALVAWRRSRRWRRRRSRTASPSRPARCGGGRAVDRHVVGLADAGVSRARADQRLPDH